MYRNIRRYVRRDSEVTKIMLLVIVMFMVAVAYLAFKNYLMTGSFGLVAAIKSMETRARNATKGFMTFIGSLFGTLLDGLAGFSGAVVSAALSGNLAAIVYLSGYLALVGVLLWNYLTTGKWVR